MAYNYSITDNKNINWFENDLSKASLKVIYLQGSIRGVSNCHIKFQYPITVISGKNGSGKSTILALATCAYHNLPNGFKLKSRENSYYTFSDFFVQSSDDIKPDGISLWYGFLYDKWQKTETNPEGKGLAYQKRTKKKDGRWSNYERRIKRNVIFIGIERIVPHSEKSTHKTYKSKFTDDAEVGMESSIAADVGFILDKEFKSLNFKRYNEYKLPIVESEVIKYSGFNMGAGENALFELFYVLNRAPEGTMIIIDEIELGLHESAQIRLIERLKEICLQKKHQIICTSHSPVIIKSLPPEGRIHIESSEDKTEIIPGISADYASGKLRDQNSEELIIFVEDDIGEALVQNSIDVKTRLRTRNIPIGSSTAIMRRMSAMYKMQKNNCITLLDGDKKSTHLNQIKLFISSLESLKTEDEKNLAKAWIEQRLYYLPGDTWPEKWILKNVLENDLDLLSRLLQATQRDLKSFINMALRSGKHNEFYSLGKSCDLEREVCLNYAINSLNSSSPNELHSLKRIIKSHLD